MLFSSFGLKTKLNGQDLKKMILRKVLRPRAVLDLHHRFLQQKSIYQGWATPRTRAELGTRAHISGTRARPRKRVNGKAAAEVLLMNIRLFFFRISKQAYVMTLILLFTYIFSGKQDIRWVKTFFDPHQYF